MTTKPMESKQKTCPICLSSVESDKTEFCVVCKWELVTISDSASKWLKELYEQKRKNHFEQYSQLNNSKEKISEQSQAIQNLSLKIMAAEKSLEEAREVNLQLKILNEENYELNNQVKFYQEKFGDSWIGNPKEAKPTIVIKWEMISPLKFRFYCCNIQSELPAQVVMLLKKNQRPAADGDFAFAFMIDTTNKRIIDSKTCELTVANNELKSGKYFLRFTNLNFHESNVLFFHKDQGSQSSSFDWDKTVINL